MVAFENAVFPFATGRCKTIEYHEETILTKVLQADAQDD